ncbi:excalibur calcium-binding domain-containing protein [Streptomyces agglomeratus]|uniref:excalibur calcium-binding domain-containing protein n=1 Tax=Streptomyces agglomeratus TaxID=285458 RepID=UPI000AF63239|nr:excalibur calcium-binding domain-containing protein [Streptomyces agglomeratus]
MTSPYGPIPHTPPADGALNATQKTVFGCGGMAAVALVMLLIAGACSPAPQVRTKAVPGPTATVTATRTVTPSPTPSNSRDPEMPKVVGGTFDEAERRIEALIDGELRAYSAYDDVGLRSDHGGWTVCFQGPGKGTKLVAAYADPSVHLVAPGRKCPKVKGTDLHTPTPTPTPTPTRDRSEGSSSSTGGGSGGGGGGGSVHYRNCDAAKAAGAAPVHRGDPGYGPHLDRDGDGSACES